ncbi:MAG: hypothetical protein M3Q39_01730 [Actinomycetota bacterium]|nr:hypothetical protein [Actinomycetota bacterium]
MNKTTYDSLHAMATAYKNFKRGKKLYSSHSVRLNPDNDKEVHIGMHYTVGHNVPDHTQKDRNKWERLPPAHYVFVPSIVLSPEGATMLMPGHFDPLHIDPSEETMKEFPNAGPRVYKPRKHVDIGLNNLLQFLSRSATKPATSSIFHSGASRFPGYNWGLRPIGQWRKPLENTKIAGPAFFEFASQQFFPVKAQPQRVVSPKQKEVTNALREIVAPLRALARMEVEITKEDLERVLRGEYRTDNAGTSLGLQTRMRDFMDPEKILDRITNVDFTDRDSVVDLHIRLLVQEGYGLHSYYVGDVSRLTTYLHHRLRSRNNRFDAADLVRIRRKLHAILNVVTYEI